MLLTIVSVIYGLAGIISAIGYIPQAAKSWRDKSQAQSTSIIAWVIWTITSFACVLYAVFVNKDPMFIGYNVLQFAGIFSVLIITLIRKRQ